MQRHMLFESSDNLMIICVDFKLNLIGRYIPRPDEHELEEITRGPLEHTRRH